MKNSQKDSIILWSIVIIILVIVAGYFIVYDSSKRSLELNYNVAQPLLSDEKTDWLLFNNSLGYSIKYPQNWNVKNIQNEVLIFNPLRKGKIDTDQPTEGVKISLIQTLCKENAWQIGFGGVSYKVACIPFQGKVIQINAAAFDDAAKTTEESIVASLNIIQPAVGISLQVISPNGGENLIVGQSYLIKWSNPDMVTPVLSLIDVSLKTDYAISFESGLNVRLKPRDTSYNWTVPMNTVPKSTYKIRVTDNSEAAPGDDSDRTFTISQR